MRIITNEELLLIAGGDGDAETPVQVVEIVGQKMNAFDAVMFDLFEAGRNANSLSMRDWRKLQMAYEEANNSGVAVPVEISPPTWEIDGGLAAVKEGPSKFTVTVAPADCYKRK